MRNNQKGFGAVALIIMAGVLLAVAFVSWRIAQNATKNQNAVVVLSSKATSPPPKTKRIVAVGDIVCDPSDKHIAQNDPTHCQDQVVAATAKNLEPDTILGLGDLQYDDGALDKFQNIFDKNWGQFKSILYPAPGNHEYVTKDASGYFTYFKDTPVDVSKGYYSFQTGDWHIISLDSNCDKIGGCGADTAQMKWLEQDLASDKSKCTIAYWHHPRFTSGRYINDNESKDRSKVMWEKLSTHKAEVVLNGHDHLYERFASQKTDGQLDASGIKEFVVGTGGKEPYEQKGNAANSQKLIVDQYGVLAIDLYSSAYKWQFVNIKGQVLDSGYQKCN